MKMKNKIAITVIPTLIIIIVLINFTFGLFFQNFVLQSERNQIDSSENSISSYINEKIKKYSGVVDDWGHWDDTYAFIATKNRDYIHSNMTESTFSSLDLSFIFLLDRDGAVEYQQYYKIDEEKFSDFPSDFSENVASVINFSKIAEDTCGILKIGDNYYFIASTGITNSFMTEDANGIMIFGRQITGLYNRRFFEEELRRIDVKRNLPLSFVYADVNGLKIINDAFGHEHGDELIQSVAEVLQTECRSDDIIARIGGDEFVILLPKTSSESAEELIKRIIKGMIKSRNINGRVWKSRPAYKSFCGFL